MEPGNDSFGRVSGYLNIQIPGTALYCTKFYHLLNYLKKLFNILKFDMKALQME